ncbi:MAG: lipid asymmetry maintenance protein MlaB [Vicinamibacterales bacterium]
MALQAFRIGVLRTQHSSELLVRCAGAFVAGAGAERPLWADLLRSSDPVEILLDLGGVTRMDAAGVGILAELRRTRRGHGGSVRLVAAPERIRILLRLTGLSESLDGALEPDPGPARVPPFRGGARLPLVSRWYGARPLAVV